MWIFPKSQFVSDGLFVSLATELHIPAFLYFFIANTLWWQRVGATFRVFLLWSNLKVSLFQMVVAVVAVCAAAVAVAVAAAAVLVVSVL